MQEQSGKTIVIIWSWRANGLGEGIWGVSGSQHLNDQVVCRDLPASEHAVEELSQLAATYATHQGAVLLFLHRHHGYHQEHVQQLLRIAAGQSAEVQVFLFGEGVEPLYLTNNPRGLLGVSGTFSARLNVNGQLIDCSAIEDLDKRTLKATHFSAVWMHYKNALAEKIYELAEDLFAALCSAGLPYAEQAPGSIYAWLNQPEHRIYLLRLLSFVGRVYKASNLSEQLRTFERTLNRTFYFEDCARQLENEYGGQALAAYEKLADYTLKHVLTKSEAVDLKYWRSLFQALFEQTQLKN